MVKKRGQFCNSYQIIPTPPMTTSFYFWTLTQEKQKCGLPIDSSMNVGSNFILNGTTLEEARCPFVGEWTTRL